MFHVIVVLSCTFLCRFTCELCPKNGLQISLEYDCCGANEEYSDVGFSNVKTTHGNPRSYLNCESVCTNSNAFCFPSTLAGCPSEEHRAEEIALEVSRNQYDAPTVRSSVDISSVSNGSWSRDYGMFRVFNGKIVHCSLSYKEDLNELSSTQSNRNNENDFASCSRSSVDQKSTSFKPDGNYRMTASDSPDNASSHCIQIQPAVLDWGQKYMYFASLSFLTVANTCNDSILHVFEPFSTNLQFYPCNFTEALVGPGEVVSICFVYLPRWLGMSSAHLILQTSAGGFLVQAKGFAIESPYGMHPLFDTSSGGRWSRNLTLFNSFDETLYVEEVTASLSVSMSNTFLYTEAVCQVNNIQESDELEMPSIKDRLDMGNDQVGLSLMSMRPFRSWEIGPQESEAIVEIDFSVESEGSFFGVVCMQLLRSSQEKFDTVMIPLEAEFDGKGTHSGSLSTSLKVLYASNASKTAIAISLRNAFPYLLSVFNITVITELEDEDIFQIKFMEGLLLFPGTDTQVAVVACKHINLKFNDTPPHVPVLYENCKLIILTNDSFSPQIEILCEEIINICSRHQLGSFVGYKHVSDNGVPQPQNMRTGHLGSVVGLPLQVKVCALNFSIFFI